MREVQIRVLADQLVCLAVVGPRRFDLILETSDEVVPPVTADIHDPSLPPLVPADALEPRTLAMGPAVVEVLLLGADPQGVPSIVQPVPVLVIDHHLRRRIREEAVQGDSLAIHVAVCVGPAARAGHTPLVFCDPLVVLGIDDGELALGQRDVADALVRRFRRDRPPGLHPPPLEPPAAIGLVRDLQSPGRFGTPGADQ
jgi:hypothetical protein